ERLGRNAHPRILHADGNLRLVCSDGTPGRAGVCDGDEHAAAVGELYGIAHEVGDDLAQAHLVTEQRAGQRGVDGPGYVDVLLVGLGCQQLDYALHAVVERQRGRVELQLVGFDLGEVEDLVDQR